METQMNALYLNDQGQTVGPYPIDQVKELLQSEALTLDSLASQSSHGPWVPLSQFELTPHPKSPSLPPPRSTLPAPRTSAPVLIMPGDRQETSGFSIASLICGILGISLLAIIFGHVARTNIKTDRNLTGAGLALAGLILGYLGIFVQMMILITIFGLIQLGKNVREVSNNFSQINSQLQVAQLSH